MKNIFKPIYSLLILLFFIASCSKTEITQHAKESMTNKDHVTISVEDPEDVIDRLCYDPRNIDLISPCSTEYEPVCACEVITFGNKCTAEGFGFQNVTKGSCLEQKCYNPVVKRALYNTLICKDEVKPVCGCNNITYKNKCEALRHGVLVSTPGSCEYGTDINIDELIEKGCFDPRNIELVAACPQVIAPVCACGVIQFGNGCQAEAAGFQNYEQGGCVENRCQSESVRKLFKNIRINCSSPTPQPVCGCNGREYNSWCHALSNGVLAWRPGKCNLSVDDINISIQNP